MTTTRTTTETDRYMDPTYIGRKAAERYLTAWDRQNGESRVVGCGLVRQTNTLGWAAEALGIALPGDANTWWGRRFEMLAREILAAA